MRLNGYVSQYTPTVATNGNNWALQGTTSTRVLIQEVVHSGYASSSTPMETRIARCSSGGTTPPSAGNVQRLDQTIITAGGGAAASFYPGPGSGWSSPPTIVAGALFAQAWNAYGGVVRWLAAPGEEFDYALTTNCIVCAPVAGTGVSAYTVVWIEY